MMDVEFPAIEFR